MISHVCCRTETLTLLVASPDCTRELAGGRRKREQAVRQERDIHHVTIERVVGRGGEWPCQCGDDQDVGA